MTWEELGLVAGSALVREPGLGEDVGVLQDGYTATVPAHGVVMVRVTGQSARLGDGGVFGPLPRPVPAALGGIEPAGVAAAERRALGVRPARPAAVWAGRGGSPGRRPRGPARTATGGRGGTPGFFSARRRHDLE